MSALPSPHPAAPSPWDALPSSVLLLARDGQALHVNTAFCAFTGLTAEDARDRGWLAAVTPAAQPLLLDALQRAEDFSLQLAWQCRQADGSLREAWVDCAAHWRAEHRDHVCLLHDLTQAHHAERAAGAQAEQFRLLADNVPVLIAYYTAHDHTCVFANQQYARTFGWDEWSIVGRTFAEIIGEAAAREIQPQVDTVLQDRRPVAYERELRREGGRSQWLEVNLLPHVDGEGRAVACFVLISDITRHRHAEQAARESEERLGKFMAASCEGIVFHRQGVIIDANVPACDLVGYELGELLGRRALDFVAPDQVARAAAVMASGQETAYESALIDKAGRRIAVEFIVRSMERGGEHMRMTVVRDIRDRQAAQARIHHLAHHDPLTGLPNRLAFMEQLEPLMTEARASGEPLALLFIDLDHFKRVNDSLGHLAGDALLQTVAQRIVGLLRATDRVARFGGDEFMVLLSGGSPREVVEEVAQKLLTAIEAPLHVDGRPITVTPSIGIAIYPGDGDTPAQWIKNADAAMYLAKKRGRATVQFFDPSLATSAYASLVMEGQLAQALQRGEFVLHFQPQVRARDGTLAGAEALVRWQHPERGLLLPDEFIPLAEQQRLMLPLGLWVLREAARAARRWHDAGLGGRQGVPVAVNLSTLQFQAAGFVEGVEEVLSEVGLPGRLLELELTERMLMDDLQEVRRRLGGLKALGIRLAVDDFGTGYSSLAHLKELPIDKMKIDRSFVVDLPERRDSAAITRAIIQMARGLDIAVIAEGVETEAQRAFLADERCDELQGELISRPLTAEAFQRWMQRASPAGTSADQRPRSR